MTTTALTHPQTPSTPSAELEACPFCGQSHTLKIISAAELWAEDDESVEFYPHSDSVAVTCNAAKPDGPGGCGAQGGFAPTEADAIAKWNTRAPASTAAMGWRPIETAPKDETPVDLWSPEWGGERHTNMRRVGLSKGNVFYDPVESGICCVRGATHWMPLPPAPQGDD
jgi:hypothetical protein